MQCAACGRELVVLGMFPGAPISCPCGASQTVTVKESATETPRWSVLSAPTVPPPVMRTHGCPRCEAELEVRSLGGVVVGACPKAHGLFVTHAALRSVKDASAGVVAALDETPVPAPAPDDGAMLLCPSCGEAMDRRTLGSGVLADVCMTHGTWFDAGELRAVMASRDAAPVDPGQAKATLDVALALEAARDDGTARAGIAVAEDLLDTFNVLVLGRSSLRRRY